MKPTSVQEFFRCLPQNFDAEAAEGLAAIYQFDLSGPQGGQYQLLIEDSACSVQEGTHPNPQAQNESPSRLLVHAPSPGQAHQ